MVFNFRQALHIVQVVFSHCLGCFLDFITQKTKNLHLYNNENIAIINIRIIKKQNKDSNLLKLWGIMFRSTIAPVTRKIESKSNGSHLEIHYLPISIKLIKICIFWVTLH